MMAQRPVFMPTLDGAALVRTEQVSFQWFPGLALAQKQKSVDALHEAARQLPGVDNVLEISSKSRERLGTALSAFNLTFRPPGCARALTVECAFQGSKVFSGGGPYVDLFGASSSQAKRDDRLRTSGRLKGFRFQDVDWPLEPQTAFYDWLYISALKQNPRLVDELLAYSAFTDIEFNPEKSVNCQAYSAATFVSLHRRGLIDEIAASKEAFLNCLEQAVVSNARRNDLMQGQLF
jgi:hypothetical protein